MTTTLKQKFRTSQPLKSFKSCKTYLDPGHMENRIPTKSFAELCISHVTAALEIYFSTYDRIGQYVYRKFCLGIHTERVC